jgi:hypothetical protein
MTGQYGSVRAPLAGTVPEIRPSYVRQNLTGFLEFCHTQLMSNTELALGIIEDNYSRTFSGTSAIEVSMSLGISKAAAGRLLGMMIRRGMVYRDDRWADFVVRPL